jgi:Leucine-rich repeat (LRR) protein
VRQAITLFILFLFRGLLAPVSTEAQQLRTLSIHKIPEDLRQESGESMDDFLHRLAVYPQKGLIKRIDLRSCNLHTIPEIIKQYRRLEQLNLNSNQIHEIPAWLNEMPRLRSLSLQQNGLHENKSKTQTAPEQDSKWTIKTKQPPAQAPLLQ